jgi:hypothetical protein
MSTNTLAAARARTDEGLPSHPVAGILALLIIGLTLALLALAWRAAETGAPVPGGWATIVFVLFVGAPWGAGHAAWVWWRRPPSHLHRMLAVVGALLPIAAMAAISLGVLPFGAVQ